MTAVLVVGAALALVGLAAPTRVRRPPLERTRGARTRSRCLVAARASLAARSARARRRLLPVDDDGLPEALDAVARALRTGASLPQALGEAHAATPGSPLGPVAAAVERGRPVADALASWKDAADRPGHRLAASALLVATEAGGGPAQAVDAVAATVRERRDVHREARALATQARASAVVIAAAPVGFTVLIAGVDPDALGFLLGTPVGWACMAAGLALDVLGLWWMLHVLARAPGAPPATPDPPRAPAWALPAVVGAAGLAVLGPVAAAMGVGAVLLGRRRRLARLARGRRIHVVAGLPDAIDLLALAVGSGAGLHDACRAVGAWGDGPVARGLADAVAQADVGRPLADGLGDLPHHLGPPARPLAAALVAADRYGAPLRSTLERLSAEGRGERRRAAEEEARTIPVRLLFPLVACVLPAFGLLTVVPLLVGSLRALTA